MDSMKIIIASQITHYILCIYAVCTQLCSVGNFIRHILTHISTMLLLSRDLPSKNRQY